MGSLNKVCGVKKVQKSARNNPSPNLPNFATSFILDPRVTAFLWPEQFEYKI